MGRAADVSGNRTIDLDQAGSGSPAFGFASGDVDNLGPISRCETFPLHDHALYAHGARKTPSPCPRTGGNLPLVGHDLAGAFSTQGGNRRGPARPRADARRGR